MADIEQTFSPSFGERLSILRKREGFSRKELAEIIGVSYTTIANYELDKHIPNAARLSKLSIALNTTMNMVLRGYEPKKEDETLI